MTCAKMDELIEMPLGVWTWVHAGNRIIDGGPDRPMQRGNF